MIPKRIIYGWFGKGPKDGVSQRCIESWKQKCPDYEIAELNETNVDIHSCPYIEGAYQNKKWAFVTDYAKLWYLAHVGGGFILDADCYLTQGLDAFLDLPGVIGYQNWGELGTSVIGLPDNSSFARRMVGYYQKLEFKSSITVNMMLTKMIKSCYSYAEPSRTHHNLVDSQTQERLCVFPKNIFAGRGNKMELLIRADSVAFHMFTWSWMTSVKDSQVITKSRNREINEILIDSVLCNVKAIPFVVDDRPIPKPETKEWDDAIIELLAVSGCPGSIQGDWTEAWKKFYKKSTESFKKLEEFSEKDLDASVFGKVSNRKKLF